SVFSVSAISQSLTVGQVNSDQSVLAFVKQENYSKETAPQWNHFYLTDGAEWLNYYNLSGVEIDSVNENVKTLRWQKADLNGDAKPDLIVSGYIARRPNDRATTTFKLLVFLSQRGNGYTEMNLIDDQLDKYPAYFNVVTLDDGNAYLQLHRWQTGANTAMQIPLLTDTLRYNNTLDYFVHLSNYLYPQDVQRVDYHVQEDWHGSYHTLTVENVNGNSFPIVISQMHPPYKVPSVYRAKLTKVLWANIDTLMRSLNISSDTVVYNQTNTLDKLSITVTIHYIDGTKKVIKDYDADASYTLMSMYQVFEDIVNNTLDLYEQRQIQMQQSMQDDDWNW
ncbi:MAG TPA: hypothetical protein VGB84_01225, partial [Arachidicoccus sp.]